MLFRTIKFILILFLLLGFRVEAKNKFSKAEIDQKKNKASVIMFYAPWCGYCKMMFPVMQDLQKKYTQLNFFYIDIDDPEGRKLAQTYKGGASGVPDLQFYNKEGALVNSALGAQTRPALENHIKAIL